jgi:hypothetical protein
LRCLCVSGSANAETLQRCAPRFNLDSKLLEDFDRILNRIAVRKLVGLAEDLALLVEDGSFGRRRSRINSSETRDDLPGVKLCGVELLLRVGGLKGNEFGIFRDETLAAGGCLLFGPAKVDVVDKLVRT